MAQATLVLIMWQVLSTFKVDDVKPRKHIVKNNKLKGDSKYILLNFQIQTILLF
jgi:hypothetical protein